MRNIRPSICLLGALSIALTGCGGDAAERFPISTPLEIERSILRSEGAAEDCQERFTELLQTLKPGNGVKFGATLARGFTARFPLPVEARVVPDHLLSIRTLERTNSPAMDAAGFADRLAQLSADWSTIERAEFELDRFRLQAGGERATGEAELYLAGQLASGGRADLRVSAEVEFTREHYEWDLVTFDLVEATTIASKVAPFIDVTDAVGLHQNESPANRAMLQAFIDEHRTLAVGGISAVDWNADGLPDLIATLDDQLSTVFVNDGEGGFVPTKLPVKESEESAVFLLHLDLDGDGVAEIASTKVVDYDGEWASCGLYRQVDGKWEFDAHAFRFPNRVGLRGIYPTTIVPLDANGDGLLDLFFGVYGDQHSRGADYNLVEAHDGGDNYLFIQGEDLSFREESVERGVEGHQYTFVALALDFDGDGDEDLFEGNDFGPNILWVNDGSGHFNADERSVFAGESAYTMGVSLADHDDDGRFSIYVVNMSSEAGKRIAPIADGISETMRARIEGIAGGNRLYSQDEEGVWVNVTEGSGCAEGEWGWGALFCDLDGDGDEEIFATNGFTSHSNPELPDWDMYFWRQVATDAALLERGEATYDINEGLNFEGSYAGRQRDRLYYVPDGAPGRFVEVAWHFGLDNTEDGRCALPWDMDGDGDLDLVIWNLHGLRFYENPNPTSEFLRLTLRATQGHPAALGARVAVTVGEKTHHDVVQVVEGFQTQVPLDLHFALPGAQQVDAIEVTWRLGVRERWERIPVNRSIVLVEGESDWEERDLPRWPRDDISLADLQELGRRYRPAKATGRALVSRLVKGSDESAAVIDASGDVEYRSIANEEQAGRVFVYNREGQLRRAYRTEPRAEDLRAVLETLRDEPPFPELSVLTGRRLILDKKYQEALGHFERALAVAPYMANAAEGVARCQRLLGNLEEAEVAYLLSVEIDPDYAIGHFNLGVLRARTGRAAEAMVSYREALRIQGEVLETLLSLGEAAIIAQDPETALDAYERAVKAWPADIKPRLLLAKLLGQLKRYNESKAAFEDALVIDPNEEQAIRGIRLLERLLGSGE